MTVLVWCSWAAMAGGMERFAVAAANGLSRQGWRVVLAGPLDDVPPLRAQIAPEVVFVNWKPGAAAPLRAVPFLRRLVSEWNVDVVSANGSVLPVLGVGVPVVWTEHELRYGNGSYLSSTKGLLWKQVRERLLAGRWKAVAVSEYVRERVCSEFNLGPEAVPVIHYGIGDRENLRRLPPPEMRPPYRVGFVGRFVPEKYPLDIFELARLMPARGVECEWHFFGQGALAGEIARQAEAGRAARFVVHGAVDSPATAFGCIDALAMLSRGDKEGYGMVLAEARLARRAVVAWGAGCLPEAAGPHGAVVEPPFELSRYADALAARLLKRQAPPREPEDAFSVDAMVSEHGRVLREMAGTTKHASAGRLR